MADEPEKPKRRLTKKQRALIKPSTGLPAMGAGWGGPAKGAGMGPEGLKWGEEKKDAADPAKRQTKEALAQEAMDALVEIMRTAESPGLKMQAATAVLNRVEGMPTQRTITATADELERLSDDELRAELARFDGTSVAPAEGSEAAGMSGEPTDVVH